MYTNLIVDHKERRGISNRALTIGAQKSRAFPAKDSLVRAQLGACCTLQSNFNAHGDGRHKLKFTK